MKKSWMLFSALVMVIAVVAVIRQLPSYNFGQTTTLTVENPVDKQVQEKLVDQKETVNQLEAASAILVAQGSQDVIADIALLRNCFEQPDQCNYADDDPRMQSYLAGQDYMIALRNVKSEFLAGQLSFHQSAEVAVSALTIPDGHVQFAALEIIAELDSDPQFIFPILDMLVDSHDAKVTELALTVLQKQPTNGYETQIDEVLSSTMKQGAPYVAEQVAQSILPFLSEENIDRYVDLLLEIPSETKTHRMLDVMVEEYALMQMGG